MTTSRPFSPRRSPFSASRAIGRGGLVDGADERDHDLEIGEAHPVANMTESLALHLEAGTEAGGGVSRGAAPAEHRVLFVGFEEVAAEKAGVLIGLEVAHADDDRLRRERGSDRRDTLRDALDEVVPRRRIGGGPLRDLRLERLRERVEFGEGARVDADRLVDDELEPCQADAVVRQLSEARMPGRAPPR